MIEMRLSEAARTVGGQSLGADAVFQGVVIDSRKVREGVLFAALPGTRVDGHAFVGQALSRGAAGVLIEQDPDGNGPGIRVPDVARALGDLARAWCEKLDPGVIGITGSNGKTTTKEMVQSILRQGHRVLATRGNFNNELGVPLTLFELAPEHEFAVIEMGASKAGDIDYLAGIGRPDIGLVTNIGPAHLEGFGDEAGVARAKGEMYARLPADGCAVMNAGQPWLALWREMSTASRCLEFGFSDRCDIFMNPGDAARVVHTPGGEFALQLALPGDHNLENALAATAVAIAAGIKVDQIRDGLAAVAPVPGRLIAHNAPGGWRVIDDTYNANPASLYAALQVLAGEGGEPWLVLGDMAELGPYSRKLHAEMGEAARSLGVRQMYAVGEFSRYAADAFGPGARHFSDIAALLDVLLGDLAPGTSCLVKGSRSMGMERVVEAISRSGSAREAG